MRKKQSTGSAWLVVVDLLLVAVMAALHQQTQWLVVAAVFYLAYRWTLLAVLWRLQTGAQNLFGLVCPPVVVVLTWWVAQLLRLALQNRPY